MTTNTTTTTTTTTNGVWRVQDNEEVHGLCKDIINLVMYIHFNKLQWAGHVVRMFDNINLEEIIGLPTGKRRKRWEDEVTNDAVKSLKTKS